MKKRELLLRIMESRTEEERKAWNTVCTDPRLLEISTIVKKLGYGDDFHRLIEVLIGKQIPIVGKLCTKPFVVYIPIQATNGHNYPLGEPCATPILGTANLYRYDGSKGNQIDCAKTALKVAQKEDVEKFVNLLPQTTIDLFLAHSVVMDPNGVLIEVDEEEPEESLIEV